MIMLHGACLCAALIRSADGPPVPLPKAFHPHFQGCRRRFTPSASPAESVSAVQAHRHTTKTT